MKQFKTEYLEYKSPEDELIHNLQYWKDDDWCIEIYSTNFVIHFAFTDFELYEEKIPDYTAMSEEECFQQSLVYDMVVPMDLVMAIQLSLKENLPKCMSARTSGYPIPSLIKIEY